MFWFSGKRVTFCGVLYLPLFLRPWRIKVFCFVRVSIRGEGIPQCVSCRQMSIWLYTLCCFIVGRALSRRHTQQPCVLTAVGGVLRLGGCLWFRIVFPCFLARPGGGVILFVFHLGVLVVRLEGIAMCSYCGFHALQVGSGGCAMRICVGRAGCLFCSAPVWWAHLVG